MRFPGQRWARVAGLAGRALRGTAGRAGLVLALVAALATGGWLLAGRGPEKAPTGQLSRPAAGSAQPLPPVTMASAPVTLHSPAAADTRLSPWAVKIGGKTGIPARALQGYATAELLLRRTDPGCHLSWVTLAGIGSVVSDHGRAQRHHLTAAGVESPALGSLPVQDARGHSSPSHGQGPMQLPDAVWQRYGRAAHAPGTPDRQSIDDSAITAARALCAQGRDLATGAGWWPAIRSLRDSDLFVERVLATADLYGSLAEARQPVPRQAVRAVTFAINQLGLPYVWGGDGPAHGQRGFDCSGLTTAAYAAAGITLPRTADTQFGSEPPVPATGDLQLGDLVFYGNPNGFIHHVGLYIGNGQMINAPDFGLAVQVGPVRTPGDDYAGAARPATRP